MRTRAFLLVWLQQFIARQGVCSYTVVLLPSPSRTVDPERDLWPLMATTTTTTATTSTSSAVAAHSSSSAASTSWFPTRIQETINYTESVQRLYVRQIVTETKEMAQTAMQLIANYYDKNHALSPAFSGGETNITATTNTADLLLMDAFSHVAQLVSVDSNTATQGGTVGWIENNDDQTWEHAIPQSVVRQLYSKEPKAGDILLLPSLDMTDSTIPSIGSSQWHIVQVLELWLRPKLDQVRLERHRVGALAGENSLSKRGKLPGQGTVPEFPSTLSTYSIQTTGCQMNAADSERLEGVLQHELQLTKAEHAGQADLIVFNTCSIRDHAEQKLYDALGPYQAQKRKGKQLALVVTGCVAQQEGRALLKRVPELDVVLGPQYIPHLKTVLEQVSRGEQVVATAPMLIQEASRTNGETGFFSQPVRGHDVKAWVNVIFGCNEHCTYCVVPGTRGMEQSRSMQAILQECLDLASRGYKEVTLLGQNIDAYGRDMVPKRTFAELLEYLNDRLPTGMRIRYVTSHPRYFSDRVIDAVANLDKVCECFHVPFQSGDDEVLRNMRRGYTYDSYMKIIHKIRRKAPDAAICADVIVGFPGESEEAFQKTLQLMEEVKFDNINSFTYSPRPNTEAALWENQIPEDVKSERLQRLQQLAQRHGLERSQRYVGRTETVLVEDHNPRNRKQVMGRTRQGRHVYFDGDADVLRGEFVDVQITEANTWSLMGEALTCHL